MACIIYYGNLDYDQLPTARKRMRIGESPMGGYNNTTATSAPARPKPAPARKTTTAAPLKSQYNRQPPATSYQPSSYSNNYNYPSSTTSSFSAASTLSLSPCKTQSSTVSNSNTIIYCSPSAVSNASTIEYTIGSPDTDCIELVYTESPPPQHQPSSYSSRRSPLAPLDRSEPYRPRPQPPPPPTAQPVQQSWSSNNSYNNTISYNDYKPGNGKRQTVEHRKLVDTLKRYFKFSSFRENQLEAVNATCEGLDTLVLMPTGGGKSICYQLPAIVTDGISVVVSPLKSLIEDQVSRLQSLDIRTSALMGDTPESEVSTIFYDLRQPHPEHKLLYVTPEKITASTALINVFSELYSRGMLARFVIDEAHCVSTWGADFRPDYRKLGRLRELYKDVPIMALTATAPPQVREDIYNQLKMDKRTGKTFIQSFNRPNLKFEVRPKSKGCITDICNLIRKNFRNDCGIIYCLSRNDCESVAQKLRGEGIKGAPYHAGLSDNQRKKVFKSWSSGVFQVVCATIAFGMGIDKSDVRFVIHYSVPKSVEGYYQEAGRAGRDGQIASCILYFSKSDVYRMKSMLSKGFGRMNQDKERDQSNLEHIVSYGENRAECRRAILLRYLGEEFNSRECINQYKTACDNCLARQN